MVGTDLQRRLEGLYELAACRGVGPHKLETYGAAMLAVIAPYAGDDAPSAGLAREAGLAAKGLGREALLALLAAGQTPEQIAQQAACPVAAVWEQAIELVGPGPGDDWKIVARSLIPRPDYRELAGLFGRWRAEGRVPAGDKLTVGFVVRGSGGFSS